MFTYLLTFVKLNLYIRLTVLDKSSRGGGVRQGCLIPAPRPCMLCPGAINQFQSGHNIEFSTRPASERHHPDLLRKRVYSSEFCLEYCNDLLRGSISKSRSLDQMKRFYDLSLRLSYSLWYFSWIMFRSKVQKASNIASNSTWLK